MSKFIDFFVNLWDGIKKAINKEVDDIPKQVAVIASQVVKVTGLLKALEDALESGTVITIVQLIPEGWPEKLREDIIAGLKVAIPRLISIEECGQDLDCMLKALNDWLRDRKPAGKNGDIFKLASLATAAIDGGAHPEHIYDSAVQLVSKIS